MHWKAYSAAGFYIGRFYCEFGKKKALEVAQDIWGDQVYYVEPDYIPE